MRRYATQTAPSRHRHHLRGLAKVNLEWTLVSLAYNLKRLQHLGTCLAST